MKLDASFYHSIKDELQNLPGEKAHSEMMPSRRRSSRLIKDASKYKTSAVLALLHQTSNGIHMILTERQSYGGKHSGQISFPGGKQENEDQSTIHTALRETHEEIGIHPDQVNVLGKLTDVYIPVSGFLVHPYVGFMDEHPEFILEEREVKSVFTFPVEDLLKDDLRRITKIQNHDGIWMKDIPCFEIQKKTVWGATALMLNEFRLILKRF